MKKNLISGLVIMMFQSGSALPRFNQDYGEAGFAFLKLNIAPRSIGLSGSGTAWSGSALEAADLNPAASASDSGVIFLGLGVPFREFEARIPQISWNIPVGNFRVFLGSRILKYDEIQGYDENNQSTSPYGAFTLKAQGGCAGLFHSIPWGVSLGYALHNISHENYGSVFIDAGLQYEVFRGFWLGSAINTADLWTSSAKNPNSPDPFPPTTVRAGTAYKRKISPSSRVTVSLDARTRNDEEMALPAGFELVLFDILSLRTGYPFLEPEPAMSFGAGVKWGMFLLDYGCQRHEILSAGHFMSLGVRF